MLRYNNFLQSELSPNLPPAIPQVLTRLGLLYGLWSLDAHSSTLYEAGYYIGPEPNRLVRKAILQLCSDLKPDAVALVDAIAPPDFVLNSVLGRSDGNIYENIYGLITSSPTAFCRPDWWQEFTENKPQIGSLVPMNSTNTAKTTGNNSKL